MRAIVVSCWLEAKACFIRDNLVVWIYGLVIFFATFTDFPFQQKTSDDLGPASELSIILVVWSILLAIFSRSVLRDLENRANFNQHPFEYRGHFIGKCVYISLVLIIMGIFDFSLPLIKEYYYSSSLVPFDLTHHIRNIPSTVAESMFVASLTLFFSLFRPFHYALLIGFVSTAFYAVQTWPSLENMIPLFSEKDDIAVLPYVIYTALFCTLGMLVFEQKMILAPRQKKQRLIKLKGWLKKLHLLQWTPVVFTLLIAGITLTSVHQLLPDEVSPLKRSVHDFLRSVRHIENQKSNDSKYFSYKFQQHNQWIFGELSTYADTEWEQLHHEFSLPFDMDSFKISVFIKASQKHQLGSTRGSFVVINAKAINTAGDKKITLSRTFRHELAHVLINQLAQYQFNARTDILGSFLHEGLATLVEHHWNPNNPLLISEAALHYHSYDKSLFQLIPKLDHFSVYDYRLNYSLGYVFWGEFVKLYGRQKVSDFLSQLAHHDSEDREFKGLWYLIHKSNKANIDLYKVFHATKMTLKANYQALDPQSITETQGLKDFKAVRLNKKQLLIPYQFNNPKQVFCIFRKKDSLLTVNRQLEEKSYSGRIGSQCEIPHENPDEVQLLITYSKGIKYTTRWIKLPDA